MDMNVATLVVAIGLSALASAGVWFGLATGAKASHAHLPKSAIVGVSLFVGILAFGFFASAGQPGEAQRSWIWLLAMAVGVALISVSLRFFMRRESRPEPAITPTVVTLAAVPLVAFIVAFLLILLGRTPSEVLLVPAALLAASIVGRVWLARS